MEKKVIKKFAGCQLFFTEQERTTLSDAMNLLQPVTDMIDSAMDEIGKAESFDFTVTADGEVWDYDAVSDAVSLLRDISNSGKVDVELEE